MSIVKEFLKDNWGKFSATFLFVFCQVIGTLYIPFLVAKLIDKGIVSENIGVIYSVGFQMFLFATIATIGGIVGSYLSADLAAKFSYTTRTKLFRKVQKLSLKDADQFGTSSLLTRTTSDVDNIALSFVSGLQMILPAPLISTVSIYLTYKISPKLVWIPILMILIFFAAVIFLVKQSNSYAVAVQKKMDTMMKKIHSFFTGIRVIRAFDNEKIEEEKMIHSFEDYARNMVKLNQLFAIMTPIVTGMIGGAMALILWFGGKLVFEGTMNVGNIAATVEYVALTIMYLIIAAMVVVTLPGAISSFARIFEMLKVSPEITDPHTEKHLSKLKVATTSETKILEFNQVNFSYNQSEEAVLNEINFSISRGETLGIVGGTGSGKSTIAKLMMRFSDPTTGQIKLFGEDIRTVTQDELREHISYVPQKSFLFHGTILENLRQGKPQATLAEIAHAAKIAHADGFIQTLENKYDAFVAQGGKNFSGGQRQRLCITRALVKEADLFVFDDSFSALDYQTDALVRQALKQELADVATVIIAQRISSIMHADKILVLSDGKIDGLGSHEELLQTNKVYQEFARSQQFLQKGAKSYANE